MFGLPESVLIFVALTVTVGILLLAAARLREDSFGHGRYLDVRSCTAFRPTSAIRCGKLCRYLREFPGPRSASCLPRP